MAANEGRAVVKEEHICQQKHGYIMLQKGCSPSPTPAPLLKCLMMPNVEPLLEAAMVTEVILF